MFFCRQLHAFVSLVVSVLVNGVVSLYVGSQDSFVVAVDDLLGIVYTAVADFDGVSVEDFV